jgi:cysteine desulfurase/selenocysteine lyase
MGINHMIYFDNASTSFPKPEALFDGISSYLRNIGVSPSRGSGTLARKAELTLMHTREDLAKLFNISNPLNISFTHNATHSINIVLKGLLRPGDHVIISNFEHNSVIRPLYKLKNKDVEFDIWESNLQGVFNFDLLVSLLKKNTRLIIVSHASNVIGVSAPIKMIGEIAKKKQILFMMDCTQTAGLLDINVEKDNIDILVGTGHKALLGPPGIGFLYIKEPSIVDSLYEGGSGYDSLSPYHPEHMPLKFEAGTYNYLGIAGLKASLEYLSNHKHTFYETEMNLTKNLFDLLKQEKEVIIYNHVDYGNTLPMILLNINGINAQDVARILDSKFSIIVRAGLHCAPLIHRTLGTAPQGAVRISLGHVTTKKEIMLLYMAIKSTAKMRSNINAMETI